MDEFSNLPEPIIHRIMSFLPIKEAIHMSILSKTFHSSWRFLPVIDFDQYSFFRKQSFTYTETDSFLNFVVNFLENRMLRAYLEKLRFNCDVSCLYGFDELDSRIMRMINFAIENNVRELELDFVMLHRRKYCLPPSIFLSKSIKILTLKKIGSLSRDLVLRSCPCMKIFNLIDCRGVETLTLDSNAKLKAVKIENCFTLRKIDVESAALLEYFSCDSGTDLVSEPLEFNISSSTTPNLKHLQLKRRCKENCLIQSNWYEFPYLETLKLEGSFAFDNIIKIHLEYLKYLELNWVYFDKVEIEAPSMVSFTFEYSYFAAKTPEIDIITSSCTNLKHLNFHGKSVPEIWIMQNFSQFLNLETLELESYCITLNQIELHLEYLKSLKFISHGSLSKFEIEAPNLVSFTYITFCDGLPEIDISISSTSLKHLVFQGSDIPYKWIRNNFSEFPFLETLELLNCSRMKEIKLSRLEYLKSLKLESSVEMSEVEIEAPNLVSFTYRGISKIGCNTPRVIITSKAKPDVMLSNGELFYKFEE